MGTVREKPEMELDQGSVEQIRKLFNDYVVDPLGKELKEAESQIKSDEATQMGIASLMSVIFIILSSSIG